MLLSALMLALFAYCASHRVSVIKNIWQFIYCFFLGGLSFASAACTQGAFLNIANEFTAYSAFYLLGVTVLMIMLGEAFWSVIKNRRNLFKMRIIAKGILLSMMHYNPLYLFSIVLAVETFFIFLQTRLSPPSFLKLWVSSNILPNLSLFLLV